MSMAPIRKPQRWTSREDEVLRSEVLLQDESGTGIDWTQVSEKIPGRTNKDCRKRWHNEVMGGLRKGTWKPLEDELLKSSVSKYGRRWALVASLVGNRSPDQCAKRWTHSLDPSLDHSSWTKDEDDLLLSSIATYGRRWKELQKSTFPKRSRNSIKNRFTIIARKNKGAVQPKEPTSGESGRQRWDDEVEGDDEEDESGSGLEEVTDEFEGSAETSTHEDANPAESYKIPDIPENQIYGESNLDLSLESMMSAAPEMFSISSFNSHEPQSFSPSNLDISPVLSTNTHSDSCNTSREYVEAQTPSSLTPDPFQFDFDINQVFPLEAMNFDPTIVSPDHSWDNCDSTSEMAGVSTLESKTPYHHLSFLIVISDAKPDSIMLIMTQLLELQVDVCLDANQCPSVKLEVSRVNMWTVNSVMEKLLTQKVKFRLEKLDYC